jgi:hypothetical protein
MLTTIMKYVALMALLAGILWHLPAGQRIYLDFAIAAGAAFVLVQAVYLRKYVWAAAFVAVACAFNPVWPFAFSPVVLVAVGMTSMLLFAVSLYLLRTRPRMTIPSIIEANPGSESL